MEAQNYPVSLELEMKKFLEYLETYQDYGVEALKYRKSWLLEICRFLKENDIKVITSNVIDHFIQRKQNQGIKYTGVYKTLFNQFVHFQNGESIPIREKLNVYNFPKDLESVTKNYFDLCALKGNKFKTIRAKKAYLRDFFISANCCSITDLSVDSIEKACTLTKNKNQWAVIRDFLQFCYRNSYLSEDYSILIPHFSRPKTVPSVYSVEEIRALEETINKSTVKGKRDYACFLLASRLGIRIGDIVNIKFDNLDFENNKISFIQEKTDTPITLPLLPEIKQAIKEYISVRPDKDFKEIFLRTNAPYKPITIAAFQYKLRCCFSKTNINTNGKKKGPHALRASLATSLINDSVSYETVRTILGHNDKNVIQHYAKLDIEKLRICALPAHPTYDAFKNFLEEVKQ